jgi:glyoxylase-like metal-dependent hydrolase (beta-lactamase superfamily II)
MVKKILNGLWQVGGADMSDPSDAAVYLLRCGAEAALVDAGSGKGQLRLLANIDEVLPTDVQLKYLLLTHCHFDHSGGAAALRHRFECQIVAHERDAVFLESGDSQVTAASWYRARLKPFAIDVKLSGRRNIIDIGGEPLTALHWPGHSPGSLVLTIHRDHQLVLFGQDVHGPVHPALLSDAKDYQESLAVLQTLKADVLLEGHFGIIKGREAVRRFIASYQQT